MKAMAALRSQSICRSTQIGITLIAILAGAFGERTLTERLSIQMERLRWLASYREGLAFAIVVVAITYVSLVLGELLPKRLALYNPERIASGTAGLMDFISRLCSPIVALISRSTRLLMGVLRLRPSEEP